MNSIFQVLTLAWSLQGGQYFNNAVNDAGVFSTNNNYFFTTQFEFQVPLSWIKGDANNFFIGAETENQFFPNPKAPLNFVPWQDTYQFNSGIRFYGVELGYQHECSHPLWISLLENHSQYSSNHEKVYIIIHGNT